MTVRILADRLSCPSASRVLTLADRPPAQVRPKMRGRFGRPATLGLLMALLISSTALGWTQLRNNYPGTPLSCADNRNDGYPCIEWPLSSTGYSITVYVYLWPSLESGNLNLKTDVRNGMGYWNNQPARNPVYYESTTGTNAGRVDEASVDANVELRVRAKADPGAAHSANGTLTTDVLPRYHPDGSQVVVGCGQAVACSTRCWLLRQWQ